MRPPVDADASATPFRSSVNITQNSEKSSPDWLKTGLSVFKSALQKFSGWAVRGKAKRLVFLSPRALYLFGRAPRLERETAANLFVAGRAPTGVW